MTAPVLKCSLGSCALAAASLAMSMGVHAQGGTTGGEWRYYAGDAGSTRYAPLDQIDASNVGDLEIAWRWSSADLVQRRADTNLRTTPLMVGGTLYATAGGLRDVVAIDGATGETKWVFTPDVSNHAPGARGGSGRGVAYWADGDDERIFLITPTFYLFAIDAETGQPIEEFGTDGEVDLSLGLGPNVGPRTIGSTSPPIVVGDVVVMGSTMPASSSNKESPPGDIRGYDARTGAQRWIFHTIPKPGELGHDTWEEDSWKYTGNAGAWAPLTADPELGYVYLPMETPTVDFYGGHRPGDNLFAESVLCLDAATGERVWHFQAIHHGIWDYDFPCPPILCDIVVDGKPIKAVAQVSKQGFTYVFDRVTGEPVWPIEEKPVPQSDVPGEKTSKTQPHPTLPIPYERQGFSEDDLIDFTPELRAAALEIMQRFRIGPIFTPPSLEGTLTLPGIMGGSNWPGAAVDPETGTLFVPSVTDSDALSVSKPNPERSNLDYNRGRASARGPEGLPLVKPPWGRITAIDLNTGLHRWMVPNGETPAFVREHPALQGLDIPNTGNPGRAGAMVTKTLLFVGEGSGLYAPAPGGGGRMLRAFDKSNGKVVWEFEMPANQTGVPMSYMVDGRQYIVLGIGARGFPGEFVAFALPK